MKLCCYNYYYDLNVEECPCDQLFTDYFKRNTITGKSIFHFGTGGHHSLAALGRENSVLAVTASQTEYESYVELIKNNPPVANGYFVIFTDIYCLEPSLLPQFDHVTLFHLGEFYNNPTGCPDASMTSEYARHDDVSLFDMFVSKLKTTGWLWLYAGSFGYHTANQLVARRDDLALVGEVGTEEHREKRLVVYRRRS